MQTLKVKIESLDQFFEMASQSLHSPSSLKRDREQEHTYSFPSWEALHRLLTPVRLGIVQSMAGRGRMTVDEIAVRTDIAIADLASDLDLLAKNGVVENVEGGFLFPYDRIHLELEIEAAA